jgi:lysophospholipase
MAKKKSAATAAEKQLKAAVKKLQVQLAAAEKSAEKWRARARDNKSVSASIKAELASVRRRLEKAEGAVLKWKDRARRPATRAPLTAVPDPPAPAAETATTTGSGAAATPDESWTVAALRAEARSRGITGYSRKSKAELLAVLRG